LYNIDDGGLLGYFMDDMDEGTLTFDDGVAETDTTGFTGTDEGME